MKARLEALETEAAELRFTVAAQSACVAVVEHDVKTMALVILSRDRRTATLARLARAGARRLNALDDLVDRVESSSVAAEKVATRNSETLLALATRVDRETEETHRVVAALFERLEMRNRVGKG